MTQVKMGNKVKVRYKGYLNDGSVFDSSSQVQPVMFTIGLRVAFPMFENALIGMNEGDIKKVIIPPEEAYGHYNEDLVMILERSKIPPDVELRLGMKLHSRENKDFIVTIMELTEDKVKLDGNHPLAGEEFIFEIELLKIL